MIRSILAATLLAAPVAAADFESISSSRPVAETMDALVAAVEGAGATVFARIDHAEGARAVEMELAEAQLLVFGNPRLGTPAMQDDIRAGLMLPLRVLVYADEEGETQVFWQEPEEMFDDLRIDDDSEYVEKMEGALEALTAKAVE
ncbi:MAG: DUF302 domain-containing protein [Jannaschia sp.]